MPAEEPEPTYKDSLESDHDDENTQAPLLKLTNTKCKDGTLSLSFIGGVILSDLLDSPHWYSVFKKSAIRQNMEQMFEDICNIKFIDKDMTKIQ